MAIDAVLNRLNSYNPVKKLAVELTEKIL